MVEARGPDGGPPYVVRWSDGHEGLFYPGPGALLRVGEHAQPEPPPAAPAPSAPEASAGEGPGHVRDWHIQVSIFERGDDTDASVVLLADALQHLTAHGHTRRSTSDLPVPEIGDEVAVARALRRLADRLFETAAADISDVTGEQNVTLKG